MTRPKLVVVNNDVEEQSRSFRDGRGYRFDLSRNKLIFYAMSFVLSLCFMFALGIFVGRGVPMVRSDDFSMKGRLMRFLGLEKQTGQPFPRAETTWEDPRKMLESLKYYEDLTHKGGMPKTTAQKPPEPVPDAPVAAPAKEPPKEAAKRLPASRPYERPSALQAEKPQKAEIAGEQYTLLVASLKEKEAQALIEKLKARGYSPRVESLDLGAVKWNRILVGSFSSRDSAIKFADEFNSKENMEALVTRNPN